MSSEITWSLIIGSLSVGLGWILNELSQYFRNQGAKKRIINNVIFNLLNIRFELNKLNQKGLSKIIINKMNETLGDPLPPHDISYITDIINTDSKEIIEYNVFENLESISKKFDEVLQEFAKIEPTEAYRLSDEAKIFRKIDDLGDYLKAVQKKYGEAITEHSFSEIQKHLKENIFNESINSLEVEITKLSLRTSSKIRNLILQKLDNQNSTNFEDDDLNEILSIVQNDIK